MNKAVNIRKVIFIIGILLSIIVGMVLIAQSSLFHGNPDQLSIGITLDLLITAPIIYFILIRKTNVPKTTLVPFLILMTVVCSYVLPSQNQYYLDLFKVWILPIIELVIVLFVAHHVRKEIKSFKSKKSESFDFFSALKNGARNILPERIVIPFSTEIAVFYYGFFHWKRRKLASNEFSYHKDNSAITVLVAVIFLVAIETVGLHALLSRWSDLAAWILTGLSIYSGVQLFGFVRSMYKRPIIVNQDALILRYGIMCETEINLENIESIEFSSTDLELDEHTRKLSFLGNLSGHNVLLHLKEKNTLIGLYGKKQSYSNLAVFVNDKEAFKNRIESQKR